MIDEIENDWCNYCTLKIIKEQAKKDGNMVVIDIIAGGGVDVYVHGLDEKTDRSVDSKGNHGKQWKAWFMELGDHCEC